MGIKNYIRFVNEEIDDFYDDLNTDSKRLKFFASFNKTELKEVKTNFSLPEPKKRFQPKVKSYKKSNNNKGIF
tara:strand:+ start:1524 stop:1742 length:219 start_codon:yes stop_codon:yes gene_type:complete